VCCAGFGNPTQQLQRARRIPKSCGNFDKNTYFQNIKPQGLKHTIKKNGTYFMTMTIVDWGKVFKEEKFFEIILESFQFYSKKSGLNIYAYRIMTNHIHLVANCDSGFELKDVIRNFKRYTSNGITTEMNRKPEKYKNLLKLFSAHARNSSKHPKNKVWQVGNHAIELYSGRFTWTKINYIHRRLRPNSLRGRKIGNILRRQIIWEKNPGLIMYTV
jgi:putative transposase